ncbi:MAG: AMMECR1 domain-containing protein [bacterium]
MRFPTQTRIGSPRSRGDRRRDRTRQAGCGARGAPRHVACGVFVTLVGRKGVRGCYGTLDGEGTLEERIISAAQGAAARDLRSLPVKPSEVDRLTVIVSLTLPAEPIADWRTVDPDRFGLLVTSGGKSAVLLPGEARTASWEMSETLAKAGIGPAEPVTAFRFRTLTLVSRGLP